MSKNNTVKFLSSYLESNGQGKGNNLYANSYHAKVGNYSRFRLKPSDSNDYFEINVSIDVNSKKPPNNFWWRAEKDINKNNKPTEWGQELIEWLENEWEVLNDENRIIYMMEKIEAKIDCIYNQFYKNNCIYQSDKCKKCKPKKCTIKVKDMDQYHGAISKADEIRNRDMTEDEAIKSLWKKDVKMECDILKHYLSQNFSEVSVSAVYWDPKINKESSHIRIRIDDKYTILFYFRFNQYDILPIWYKFCSPYNSAQKVYLDYGKNGGLYWKKMTMIERIRHFVYNDVKDYIDSITDYENEIEFSKRNELKDLEIEAENINRFVSESRNTNSRILFNIISKRLKVINYRMEQLNLKK